MALGHSPQIVTNGMVLCLDAANPKNFNLTEVEVLVVAGGGGGGGGDVGAGGGAGGLIYNRNFAVTPGSALTVTVGAGGAGSSSSSVDGSNGSNSVFGSLTATGGGGGASWGSGSGQNGGSGGGSVSSNAVGQGTVGQGNNGGNGLASPDYPQGGGGGAGGVGQTATIQTRAGDGGVGLEFPQFASVGGSPAGWFAGGGGGGVEANSSGNSCIPGTGGLGGGGNGGRQAGTAIVATSGTTNTGGGGGGNDPGQGGNGGSGIVIVRYPGPQKAIGGTVTTSAGHTIHTFTTVGSTTFTPLVATNNSAILGLSDFSGNNNFGTTANSPTYSSANGGSVSFDGGDDYISIGSQSLVGSGNSPLSVEIWLYNTRNWTSGQYSMPIRVKQDSEFFISLYNPSGTLNIFPVFRGSTQWGIPVTQSDYVNKWVCLTVVYNGGDKSTASSYDTYSNGVKLPYGTNNFGAAGGGGSNCNIIGADGNSGCNVATNFYLGNISSVKIYNRALTAAEISQNFNALRGRFGI